jgi:hypothetical protein
MGEAIVPAQRAGVSIVQRRIDPMFGRAGRRLLSLRSSRRLTALVAAIVVLGAVCVSAAQAPTASAQGWPWWGNNNWGNTWWGNNWYGAYGSAYGNPLTNVYGYGLSSYPYNLYGGGGYLPGVVYANVVTSSSAQPSATSMSVDIYQPVPVTGPVTIGYGVSHTYAVTGEYCTDKSGGKVWIIAGAPTDGLTC